MPEPDPRTTTVAEVFSHEPIAVGPDDDLDYAMNLMAAHQLRRLPVVDGDKLVGMLSQADVARMLGAGPEVSGAISNQSGRGAVAKSGRTGRGQRPAMPAPGRA